MPTPWTKVLAIPTRGPGVLSTIKYLKTHLVMMGPTGGVDLGLLQIPISLETETEPMPLSWRKGTKLLVPTWTDYRVRILGSRSTMSLAVTSAMLDEMIVTEKIPRIPVTSQT
jgi:hypothetical protein